MGRISGRNGTIDGVRERSVQRQHSPSRPRESGATVGASVQEASHAEVLQRTLGNRAVRRMLAFGEDAPTLTSPGEAAERAASRAAAVVAPVPESEPRPSGANTLSSGGRSVRGVPLPPAVRDHFGGAFGHDFGDVRVHTDGDAAAGAAALSAAAFTVGDDIAFARGRYRPDTERGGTLLAHELAHVVQNAAPGADSTRVARQQAPPKQGGDTDAGTPTETPASPAEKPSSPASTPVASPAERAGAEAGEKAGTATAEKAGAAAAEKAGEAAAEEVSETSEATADPLTRVRTAKKRVRDRKTFHPLVAGVYHANPNAGIEAWTATIWERLGLKGIPRESDDKQLNRELQRFRLERYVVRALAAEFGAIRKATWGKPFVERVAAFLKQRLVGVPTVDSVALADVVWTEMLACGRIDALPKRVQWAAKQAWGRVRAKGVGTGYAKWATEATSADALATVGDAEKQAAVAALEPVATWVDTPAEVRGFLDTVATKQGLKPSESEDDRVARTGMNDRANLLLTVAEVELIRRALPAKLTKKLTPTVWLTARPSYLAALEVPIWRYYTEFIQPYTFLGHKIPKANGLHRDIVPLLPAVEQTMLDEAGPRYSRVKDLPFRPQFYGFRFQPWGEDPEKGRISYHGTGRAFDMMAAKNPYFGKTEMTLVSLVSGTWVHELTLSRSELSRLADEQRPLLDRRRQLRQQLADPEGDETRRDTERELARTERGLQSVHGSERAKRLVAESSAVRQGLETAERKLQTNWPKFAAKTGLGGIDTSSLSAFLKSVAEALWNPPKKGGKQSPAADFPALVTFVEAHLKRERAALDAAERAEQRRRKERVKRLESLLELLTKPRKGRQRKKAIESGRPAAPGVGGVAKQGITNQPEWMIRAFTRHGWSWGGSWSSVKDAMHFDYMGALEGIRK